MYKSNRSKYTVERKEMGNYAFSSCSNLQNVSIANGIDTLSVCAFSGCNNLININIPNSVTSIGDSAFRDCKV